MNNNQNTKKIFYKNTIKNIIILVLLASLIIVVILLFRSTAKQKQIFDLQSQVQTLTTSNDDLYFQIEENKIKLAELENNNNILQKENEELVAEKETFEAQIQQLKSNIANLNSQIVALKQSSNASYLPSVVGIWTTTVTTNEYSIETQTFKDLTYTTTYEFKSNGDFYINENKVGTYKDKAIFFKDSNDKNFRTASYNLDNDILYVNLYQSNTDICVSTDFYKCEKK